MVLGAVKQNKSDLQSGTVWAAKIQENGLLGICMSDLDIILDCEPPSENIYLTWEGKGIGPAIDVLCGF